METIFRNLTPHTVIIEKSNGQRIPFDPSGIVARVAVRNVPVESLNEIPVTTALYGEVENVPDPEDGVTYIVSMLVGARLAGTREDIVGPDSGSTAIRENGQIVAVRGFIRY